MLDSQMKIGLDAVEETLTTVIDSDVETLFDASRHIISSGGKRVRPRVILLAYLAAGGEMITDAVDAAAAVELVHTATLVHDDINDHSALRRGQASVHKQWGRTFALLTGDYMFAKVYEMMSPYGVECNKIMSSAAVTLVEGETLQAAAAKKGEMDRETYKQVIERKTASLFSAGARMGAVIAGADDELKEALTTYGHYLGVTFQIVDDILDLIGDPEEMGKPAGLDMAQNRGVGMTVNGSNGHTAVLEAPAVAADPIEAMMAKLRSSGAVDIARAEADRMAQRAYDALENVPPSPARDELSRLVDMVLDRKK